MFRRHLLPCQYPIPEPNSRLQPWTKHMPNPNPKSNSDPNPKLIINLYPYFIPYHNPEHEGGKEVKFISLILNKYEIMAIAVHV